MPRRATLGIAVLLALSSSSVYAQAPDGRIDTVAVSGYPGNYTFVVHGSGWPPNTWVRIFFNYTQPVISSPVVRPGPPPQAPGVDPPPQAPGVDPSREGPQGSRSFARTITKEDGTFEKSHRLYVYRQGAPVSVTADVDPFQGPGPYTVKTP
jgi:hypothetical protein